MKRNQEKKGICPLCGNVANLTREHIPPKNLFLEPRPKNMITVWTCEKCNSAYSKDEEYFRIYIVGGAQPGSEGACLWDEKVEGSTLQRSPKLRQELLNGMDIIQEYHKSHPLKFVSGDLIPEERVRYAMLINKERIDRVVEKIVRCLYFKHFNSVLSPDLKVSVETELLKDELEKTIKEHKGFVGNKMDALFIYWFGQHENGVNIKWILLFHPGTEHFKYFRATIKKRTLWIK